MIIYQILPRLYSNANPAPMPNGTLEQSGAGKLADLGERAIAHIKSLGCDTVWLCGVLDHATQAAFTGKPAAHPDVVKGKAGSPYAIRNFFDVAPYLAENPERRLQEFREAIDRLHNHGLKVIIDFVPNHTARAYVPLPGSGPASRHPADGDDPAVEFDPGNFYFYLNGPLVTPLHTANTPFEEDPAKATGNDCFKAEPHLFDWWETVKINYGYHPLTGREQYEPMPKSWLFMASVLEYWLDQGVDGFRCDMVDMVPLRFWQWALPKARTQKPDCLFIGESYDPHRYQGLLDAGFDYLYDKVGLYDASLAWLDGHKPAGVLGTTLWNNRPFSNRLLRFSENHDEVRLPGPSGFGKTMSEEEARSAGLKAFALAAFAGAHDPVMLYMGQELGEPAIEAEGFSGADGKTTIFDFWSLASLRRLQSGGAWNGADLTQTEAHTLAHYRTLLRLKTEVGPEARLYNLQPSNPNGYGAVSFEDGFFFLLYNAERFWLIGLDRQNRTAEWQAVIPEDFFNASGLAIRANRVQSRFPVDEAAEVRIRASAWGLLLSGLADTTLALILEF